MATVKAKRQLNKKTMDVPMFFCCSLRRDPSSGKHKTVALKKSEGTNSFLALLSRWFCDLTDIFASPRNNGSRLPTSLRRQKRAGALNATKISEDEFAFAILPLYNKYYSAFLEHSLNYYTNSHQYSLNYFMIHIMPKLLKSANTNISTH